MANNLLTIDMITTKALEMLENSLVLSRNVNREYDDSYAVPGAKIGSTLRIRLPDRVNVNYGAALTVQDDQEQFTTLPVTKQVNVGVNFTTAEMTMSLDDFADRVLKPRISQIAASIDADVATSFSTIYQTVGTPGTTPSTSQVLLAGMQKLNEAAAPLDERYAVVNPAANAGLVEGLKGLFNPMDVISRQFKRGLMGTDVLGFDEISMSQSVQMFTTGTRVSTGATVTNTVAAQGQSTVDLTGLGANATVLAGDVFTIAGCYSVNPQTRQTTGSLQQFVVLTSGQASAGGVLAGVAVSPAIYPAPNALATVDSFPVAGSAVTFTGAPSTTYPQNLLVHKDAIALATADLILPSNVDMAARVQHNGISLRIVRNYDINNDRMPCRIDVLYGFNTIRPALGVRLWG
jgi:hypothetical protein